MAHLKKYKRVSVQKTDSQIANTKNQAQIKHKYTTTNQTQKIITTVTAQERTKTTNS